jgi:hypothetical protein
MIRGQHPAMGRGLMRRVTLPHAGSSTGLAPHANSVCLKAPRLARIARWCVAGSGRNLSAGPIENILRRFRRESG